jgi:hypothetical protein
VPGYRDEQRPGHEKQRRHPDLRELGQLGSAVLRDVGAMLEDPIRMLAWS